MDDVLLLWLLMSQLDDEMYSKSLYMYAILLKVI
jgi:hypothetical protein